MGSNQLAILVKLRVILWVGFEFNIFCGCWCLIRTIMLYVDYVLYLRCYVSDFSALRRNNLVFDCCRVDNNLKVVLMLEIFLHEDENLFKV